ncbi:hypothetical protein B0H17DRAFT_1140626 [Mycena rosella]|uniref:Uncharacterized protein n=1 Tax=Mycena rosella TaxID=1033263 RepID=A0AAD7D1G5_MYCRO|nr:hypothetical protein B0H17DRAFT_1140626 [Mycena rosella]
MSKRNLTDLGHDILLKVCAEIFEDNPRQRVALSWCGETRVENEPPCIFPGPPSQILLDLAPIHSELAAATRPYIWSEVLLAFGSEDPTEAGIGRLERAEQPHIAPYVRALFLSFNFCGDDEDHVPQMVSIVGRFTGLRAVCLGTFQSYRQPVMYAPLAAALGAHPSIDTLVVWHMTRAMDLIAEDSTRVYHVQLEYCHEGSTVLLARPARLASLRLQNMEQQGIAAYMPAGIWDSLENLAPGSGRTPALRTLDLSEISYYSPGRSGWMDLGRRLSRLRSFTYAGRGTIEMAEARQLLGAFRHVRELHFIAPSDGELSDEDLEEVELAPEFVALLSKMPLERLILNVWVPAYLLEDDANDPEEIGYAAVEELATTCPALEGVQLRYLCEGMGCEAAPVILEYSIKKVGEEAMVEVVEPKPLEGTILAFLDWR